MRAQAHRQLYDAGGQAVALGGEIARGGEGVVCEVTGREDHIAKLYHKVVDGEKAEKISSMVSLRTERLSKLTAWPLNTLHERPGGQLIGFLMPRLTGYEEIHVLYGVKSRLDKFPDATWPFLIRAAANVARAFRVIHEHGHVIGDVNHGGIFVAKDATVKLVDCDSFQIAAGGRKFLCEVGVDTHTPPELQGRPLRGIVRGPDHDRFGLAVIIFQLLFMGRHPFSGGYLGPGEMNIPRAIGEYRFAYGPGAASRQMLQPPGTVSLEAASKPVAQLFERAFGRGGSRPSAEEWVTSLDGLAAGLKQCAQNSGHYFLKNLTSCPWCQVEARAGVMVFHPVVIVGTWDARGGFNITIVWAQITAVDPPDPLPTLSVRTSLNITLSPKALKVMRGRIARSFLAGGLLAVFAAVLIASSVSGAAAAWLIIIGGLVAAGLGHGGGGKERRELTETKREAERRWQEVEKRWRTQAGDEQFIAKRKELEARKAEYENLPNVRLQKMRKLEMDVRESQRRRFLDRFRINDAQIKGIGHTRKVTLRSYGIETADDVTERAVLAIPGFGPTYTYKLIEWRRSVEQKFVFDPAKGVDPADRAVVEREVAAAKAKLEQELAGGPQQLLRLGQQITAARESMRPSLEEAARALAQSEADAGEKLKLTLAYVPTVLVPVVALITLAALKPATVNRSTYVPTAQPSSTAKAVPGYAIPTPAQTGNINSQLSPEQQAKTLFDQGVTLTKSGKYAEAAEAYKQALVLKPDMAEAQHEIGYAYLKLSKYEESVAASRQAAVLRPKNAETYRNLGLAYQGLKRWPEAASAFRKAIEIKPDHATTYYNLGVTCKQMPNASAAAEAFGEAVRLKPDYAQAHYELALAYLSQGDKEAAIEEHTTLTTLNPKLAERLYELLNK